MFDDPSIRTAGPADAALVRDLVRAAYARWVPLIGREPRPMTADYEAAVRSHRIDLFAIAGEVLGLVETDPRADHLWIENVAVRPKAQGRGLGSRMLAHAESLARAAGRTELRLLTNAAFAANVALYSRLGYTVFAAEPFMGGLTLYLSKRLG